MRDVMLIHLEQPLSREKREAMREMFDGIQERTGFQPIVFEKGISGEVHRDLSDLVSALHDQTAALRELAESNRAVVDLVLTQQAEAEDDEDAAPRNYLDGDPIED